MKLNKNKKNLGILAVAVVNLIATFAVVTKLSGNLPLNFGADNIIDKMCSKYFLLIIPAIVTIISALQVLYRLSTMEKPVTMGKLVEDAMFSIVDGALIAANWVLVYIGMNYTSSLIVSGITIPAIYLVLIGICILLIGFYSTYPINRFQSPIGLRTKETMEDKEVWRLANRFNGFTGFVGTLTFIGIIVNFILNGFNWIVLVFGIIIVALLNVVVPRLYAKMVGNKKEDIVIE